MIIYCCRTTYLDILRVRLEHRNFLSDTPDLFVRQMYSSHYGDGTCAYRSRGRTIHFVRVAFCQQCYFILRNLLRG